MKSHKTIRLEQPPQLLHILHLNHSLEQTMLVRANQIATELREFIQDRYPAHLDRTFKISMFTLDKDQANLEHNCVSSLFKKSSTKLISLDDAVIFLKLAQEIEHKLPDGNYLKDKIKALDLDGFMYDISQQYYGTQKNLSSYLLSILMHKKADAHDRLTKKRSHSSIETVNSYHLLKISEHQRLMSMPCGEFYQHSAVPTAIASSILFYITDHIFNYFKKLADNAPAPDLSELASDLLNKLAAWVSVTEGIDIATLVSSTNHTIHLKMINNIIEEMISFHDKTTSAGSPSLTQENFEKVATQHIVNQFQSKLLKPNQLAAQIMQHRIHKITEEVKTLIMDVEFNSSQELEELRTQFRDLKHEQYIEILLNQYSLFIISDQMNHDINSSLHQKYSSSDTDSYFTLLQDMTTRQQETAYLTLLLGLQFIEHLKYLEKAHFGDLYHQESADNLSKLAPTQHNSRLQWYSDSLRQAFYQPRDLNAPVESASERFLRLQSERAEQAAEDEIAQILREEGIAPKHHKSKRKTSPITNEPTFIDCSDVLGQKSFLRDLHYDFMNILINTDINNLCESLDDTLKTHLSSKLDPSKFEDYQNHLVLEWKRELTKAFENFKTQLHQATHALKTDYTGDCDPLTLIAITMTKAYMPPLASKPENPIAPPTNSTTETLTTTPMNYKYH